MTRLCRQDEAAFDELMSNTNRMGLSFSDGEKSDQTKLLDRNQAALLSGKDVMGSSVNDAIANQLGIDPKRLG